MIERIFYDQLGSNWDNYRLVFINCYPYVLVTTPTPTTATSQPPVGNTADDSSNTIHMLLMFVRVISSPVFLTLERFEKKHNVVAFSPQQQTVLLALSGGP